LGLSRWSAARAAFSVTASATTASEPTASRSLEPTGDPAELALGADSRC